MSTVDALARQNEREASKLRAAMMATFSDSHAVHDPQRAFTLQELKAMCLAACWSVDRIDQALR
jgi:hypothetical protein